MTEAQLLASVLYLAAWTRWWAYHVHDSRRSAPGFPDLVLVHRGTGRTLFRELKSEKGRLTVEQREVLELLGRRNDVGVWTPADWTSGAILRELKTTAAAA